MPPVSPGDINSLAFWYAADTSPVIETGGLIERWDDLSGNGNHAVQTTAAERPSKLLDGEARDVIRFDGLDDTLAVASPPDLAAGVSLFAAFVVRSRTDFAGIVSAAAATGVDHEMFFSLQNASAPSNQFQWFGWSAGPDPILIERDDSGSTGIAILSAGSGNAVFQDQTGHELDTYEGNFGLPDQIVIAGHYDEGTFGYAALDLYEIGLYARALTVGERTTLSDYLKNKYGL